MQKSGFTNMCHYVGFFGNQVRNILLPHHQLHEIHKDHWITKLKKSHLLYFIQWQKIFCAFNVCLGTPPTNLFNAGLIPYMANLSREKTFTAVHSTMNVFCVVFKAAL